MEHIWKQLGKKDKKTNFELVDFHAWKYQDTPASWAYLYEAFANKYFEMPQKQNGKVLHFIWEFIKTWIKNCSKRFKINLKVHGRFPLIAFFLLLVVDIVWDIFDLDKKILNIRWCSILVMVYLLSKIFDHYRKSAIQLFKKYTKKRSLSPLLGLQKEIQDELRILLKVWLPEFQNKKILLFVDDLDRCSEERLIQVIDSLRIMLEDTNISRRVFALIAVDDLILVRAIQLKYQRILENSEDSEKLTREYLDKLFLIGVKLNPLNESEKEAIMYSIIKDKLAPISKTGPAVSDNGTVTANPEATNPQGTPKAPVSPNLTEMNYKIIPSLFDNKKIKKLSPPILEQLRNHENEAIGNSDFIEILSSLHIPKEESDLILKHSEFQPELNEEEHKRFKKLFPFLKSATPRSIRILYYQYILAKRLLKKFKPIYTSLSQKDH